MNDQHDERHQITTPTERWARRQPRLVIELTLEELPVCRIEADSAEDEIRLLGWARCSSSRRLVREVLEDVLDEHDRRAA